MNQSRLQGEKPKSPNPVFLMATAPAYRDSLLNSPSIVVIKWTSRLA